jgi:hypothetical protein
MASALYRAALFALRARLRPTPISGVCLNLPSGLRSSRIHSGLLIAFPACLQHTIVLIFSEYVELNFITLGISRGHPGVIIEQHDPASICFLHSHHSLSDVFLLPGHTKAFQHFQCILKGSKIPAASFQDERDDLIRLRMLSQVVALHAEQRACS